MDVESSSFQPKLVQIMEAIAGALFVSIDMEFSGIPTQVKGGGQGKQSLQQRYSENRDAAEKYQVLQVGITCVEEDVVKGQYLIRPYNFNLNPIIGGRLDLERDFSFQSGAIEFLLGIGFKIDLPFLIGIPYLSREEEALAKKKALSRNDKSKFSNINLTSEEKESQEFITRVRGELKAWEEGIKSSKKIQDEFCNVSTENFSSMPEVSQGLNNFQKRLVHQLVRGEFPSLVTISRPGFIQVVPYDKDREDMLAAKKLKQIEENIGRQVGFRWVIESMVGGSIEGIDPKWFARKLSGEPKFVNQKQVNQEFIDLKENLARKQTVLVGHNIFMDLVYFYATFIGKLPEDVEDFKKEIRKLFPLVIDTKYLATHECGSINPKSSLEEIEKELRVEKLPIITTHENHNKYTNTAFAHEAGYDSSLTANILIKLSAKLDSSRDGPIDSLPTDSSSIEKLETTPSKGVTKSSSVHGEQIGELPTLEELKSKLGDDLGFTGTIASGKTKIRKSSKSQETFPEPKLKFGGENMFDVLRDLELREPKKSKKRKRSKKQVKEIQPDEEAGFAGFLVYGDNFSPAVTQNDIVKVMSTLGGEILDCKVMADETSACAEIIFALQLGAQRVVDFFDGKEADGRKLKMELSENISIDEDNDQESPVEAPQEASLGYGGLIPRFNSDFWNIYGNKLRVFGTDEAFMDLNPTEN
ncbi:MAG: hypothetical protein M1829_001922 [Trizodia sp. TS-e1964]|nr:MAG: hypothetical protein M1829_001922 [Trizodia sp. TS-e1964]